MHFLRTESVLPLVLSVIPESRSPGFVVLEENTHSKNRFPTTTFGNDGDFSLFVIPECCYPGSVVVFLLFATLQKECCPINQKGLDNLPPARVRPAGCGLQGGKSCIGCKKNAPGDRVPGAELRYSKSYFTVLAGQRVFY